MKQTGQPALGPTLGTERITSLDVLRSFALMGILVVNIAFFAIPDNGNNPSAYSDFQGTNYWVVFLTNTFFKGNFFILFCMLFGAGIYLMAKRLEEKGLQPLKRHILRMLWLLAIGFLHLSLLWGGDILFNYGLAGLVMFLFYKLSAKKTLAYAIIIMALLSLYTASSRISRPPRSPRRLQTIEQRWQPSPEIKAEQMAQYRINWWTLVKTRAKGPVYKIIRSRSWLIVLQCVGWMLWGMALIKLGFFNRKTPIQFYKKVFFFCLSLGIVLPVLSWISSELYDWQFSYFYRPSTYTNFWGPLLRSFIAKFRYLLLPMAYMSGMVLLVRSGKLRFLIRPMAAMGRMALTNYLLMSLFCTTLFFGYGWDLYGRLDRTPLILIVFAILAFQMWFSYHWLEKYRFGPVEWIWRSLTYRRHQPMRLPQSLKNENNTP